MSLFQCERCGCVENTALSSQGCAGFFTRFFDWSKMPEREGLLLCSACAPTVYKDGKPTKFGKWHGEFKRTFLPLGMFKTNNVGNIEHVETGSDDYRKYVIDPPEFILPELSEDDLIERPNGPLF